jgi:hypothetical protein
MMPPVWVFPGKRRTRNRLEGCDLSTWVLTENGWPDGNTHLYFLHCLKRHMDKQKLKKVLLLLDGAPEHRDISALEFARKNNIAMVFFPPAMTAFIQPLDVHFFAMLKKAVADLASAQHGIVTESNLGKLVEAAYEKLTARAEEKKYKSPLQQGFEMSGLVPWDEARLEKEGAFRTSDVLLGLSEDSPKVVAAKALTTEELGVIAATHMAALRPELQAKLEVASAAAIKASGLNVADLFITSPEYIERALKKAEDEKAEEEAKEKRKEEKAKVKRERDEAAEAAKEEKEAKKAKRLEEKAEQEEAARLVREAKKKAKENASKLKSQWAGIK